MAAPLILTLLLFFASPSHQSHSPPTPYLSPHTFFLNHLKMLQSFKIYIYPSTTNTPPTFNHPSESAFYSSLLNSSSFLTSNPNQAHLFFLPFPLSTLSSRSISRIIRDLRSTYPFWNRTLGADHFYLHCQGLGYESDRNLVELKKNAVQISCFPTKLGRFVPHKDITLPPFKDSSSVQKLNYYLVNGSEFKYCLMSYEDDGSVGMIGRALGEGCVPVVVGVWSGKGQDLPLLGVVKWGEMAVFVGGEVDVDGEELRRVVRKVGSGGGYERMKALGAAAARHFVWDDDEGGDKYDAFHSVMCQLWVRRHVIRYARVHVSSS